MHLQMPSAICFNLDQSKILRSGNELNLHHTIKSFYDPEVQAFQKQTQKKCRKGENAGN